MAKCSGAGALAGLETQRAAPVAGRLQRLQSGDVCPAPWHLIKNTSDGAPPPPFFDLAAVKLVLVEEAVADQLVPLVLEGVKKMSVGM